MYITHELYMRLFNLFVILLLHDKKMILLIRNAQRTRKVKTYKQANHVLNATILYTEHYKKTINVKESMTKKKNAAKSLKKK